LARTTRMFDIIQLLRSSNQPLTAEVMAVTLGVTKRTIYRDIAALQATRVPIEGEAGIGYIMRPGFDLPPLMFDAEEVEAIVVGLALLGRTGDRALLLAAQRAASKIGNVLPAATEHRLSEWPLYASSWHAIPGSMVPSSLLRQAIRESIKLQLTYADSLGRETIRIVKPLAMIFYIEVVILAAWCELRSDFRHFRMDRIVACELTDQYFQNEAEALRLRWRDGKKLP
jgi:predicted DNA-binding transcriptional regulator YafY